MRERESSGGAKKIVKMVGERESEISAVSEGHRQVDNYRSSVRMLCFFPGWRMTIM